MVQGSWPLKCARLRISRLRRSKPQTRVVGLCWLEQKYSQVLISCLPCLPAYVPSYMICCLQCHGATLAYTLLAYIAHIFSLPVKMHILADAWNGLLPVLVHATAA